MRRSARISARKSTSILKTQNGEPEEGKSEELSVGDVTIQETPKRAPKTPKVGRTSRASTRKNINIQSQIYEDVSNVSQAGSSNDSQTADTGNNKGKDEEAGKSTEIVPEDITDKVVSLRDDGTEADDKKEDLQCVNEEQVMIPPSKKQQQRTTKGRKSMKGKVMTEEQIINTLPKREKELPVHSVDKESKEPQDNSGFVLISSEKVEMGSKLEDDVIILNDSDSHQNCSRGKNEELYENVAKIENKCHENEHMACDIGQDSKRPDILVQSNTQTLSKHSQSSKQQDISKQKKYPKFKDIGKLKISQSFVPSSGKRDLLNLTSEVFKKIPFKITKEALVTNKLEKKNNMDLKLTKSDQSNCEKDCDILQQDVISLKVDKNGSDDVRKGKITLSSELDPRIKSSELYFKIEKKGTGPILGDYEMSRKEEKKILKRSVIGSDFEQKDKSIVRETYGKKMKRRRQESQETAGKGWYNLPKTEMTDEVKRDLQVIKMRNILDPKRFYKKGDKKMSKYFQVGTVISGAAEFYSSRLPKKDRKKSMVDQLLADAEFRRRNKKKYLEIQERRAKNGKKFHKKIRHTKKEKRGRT